MNNWETNIRYRFVPKYNEIEVRFIYIQFSQRDHEMHAVHQSVIVEVLLRRNMYYFKYLAGKIDWTVR